MHPLRFKTYLLQTYLLQTYLLQTYLLLCVLLATSPVFGQPKDTAESKAPAGNRRKVEILSSVDKTKQPCYVITPDNLSDQPVPLLVSLHTWSGGLEQRNEPIEQMAIARGWIYLFPHFRGPNQHPDACGSEIAQQDILDAVAWAKTEFRIDEKRLYLTGVSGGGHMTMQMVGRHPEVWTAASAWVGISDLAQWHDKHAKTGYGEMMRKSCGGAPGESPKIDREYKSRSPLTWLHRAKDVPLDIAAGVHDGHSGSVPISHSLSAFNELAKANQSTLISADEIAQLSRPKGRLVKPLDGDQVVDETFDRAIYLRRTAGPSRVTIFEGGHEGIARAAIAWLEKHPKASGR